jgi:predicted RNase H-like HicB family nuclease
MIPDPEPGGFTARIPDIPAYGEGSTEEEALDDLQEALRTYVEAFGLDDALARVNSPIALRVFEIELDSQSVPKLPRPTGPEMIKFLAKQGFEVVRVRGSHHARTHAGRKPGGRPEGLAPQLLEGSPKG